MHAKHEDREQAHILRNTMYTTADFLKAEHRLTLTIPEGLQFASNIEMQLTDFSILNVPLNISQELFNNNRFYMCEFISTSQESGFVILQLESYTINDGFYDVGGLHSAIKEALNTSNFIKKDVFRIRRNGRHTIRFQYVPNTTSPRQVAFIFPLSKYDTELLALSRVSETADESETENDAEPARRASQERDAENDMSAAFACQPTTGQFQAPDDSDVISRVFHIGTHTTPIRQERFTDTLAAKLGFTRLHAPGDRVLIDKYGNSYLMTTCLEFSPVAGNILGSTAHVNVVVEQLSSLNGQPTLLAKIPMSISTERSVVSYSSRNWYPVNATTGNLSEFHVRLLNDRGDPFLLACDSSPPYLRLRVREQPDL